MRVIMTAALPGASSFKEVPTLLPIRRPGHLISSSKPSGGDRSASLSGDRCHLMVVSVPSYAMLAASKFRSTNSMAKKRVFVSFDYDHDAILKEFLVGQAKNEDSPFELADWSIKEAISEDWKKKARTRIKGVDVVAVICGEHTDTATGVSAEVKIAQEEEVPYFLLKGYSAKTCVKPKSAKSNDKIYAWTWDNLKKLIGGAR